jgi:putative ATP-dependent endonuclease of OLD family
VLRKANMRVHSILIKNFGPFKILNELILGPLATIVGQNDVGKSNILRALQVFFEERKIEESDVHNAAKIDDDVVIEVAFTILPEKIELEEGFETTLQDEMLIDSSNFLRIRKIYPCNNPAKFDVLLLIKDFSDDNYAGLSNLKEKDLNDRCKVVGIDVAKSGRGITNLGKRQALRNKARTDGIQLVDRELPLTTKDDLWKKINSLLPEFVLFETDTKLGVGETTFQSQFRPIVKTAAEQSDVVDAKDTFTGVISKALQKEIDKIFLHLQRHTDVFSRLSVKPEFFWDKAVSFQIYGKDQFEVENSLDHRGSGIRRLLMVAFFQYLAEREQETQGNFVFAIEEPENCLHPGLQRELVRSFYRLVEGGYQVIVTTHSPVITAAPPIEDLALIVREAGEAKAIQTPNLDLSYVAEQLGIEPSDQITGYNACIFIEGPTDIIFWTIIAKKFKDAGMITADFDDLRIGFVICGGETLKNWIDLRAMKRLNRHFSAIVDSDRKSHIYEVPGRKLEWKRKCEEQGGKFFILRKREIENYLHQDAITRSGRVLIPYDDFTDMKSIFGENVYKVISDMSCEEIMERDCYIENDVEHHEILEIIRSIISSIN